MQAQSNPWIGAVAYAVVGVIIASAVATVWEFSGLFSHGVVRFGLVALFFSGVTYVINNKPKAVQK